MRQCFLTTLVGLLFCIFAQAQEPIISSTTGNVISAESIMAREMRPQAMESFGDVPENFRSQWTAHGPYGGHVQHLAVDRTNGMNVVVACGHDMASNGGLWYSEDGGITWTPSSIQNKPMYGLYPHPTQSGRFYAGGEYGLYESTDGGANWSLIAYPSTFLLKIGVQTANPDIMVAGLSTNRGLRYSSDGGATWKNTNVTGGFMKAFAVSDANPSKMFVAVSGNSSGLYTSIDGAAWTSINPANSGECFGVYVDPENADIIILNAEFGLFKSEDGGTSWSNKLPVDGYFSCSIVKYNNVLRAAFWYSDIYESADNGNTWTIVPNNIPEKTWSALAVSDAGFLAASNGTIVREVEQELVLSVEGLNNAYVHCVAYYADRNELWAGTEGSGTWCSYDMGLNWEFKSTGLQSWWAFTFAPTDDYNRQHGRMLVATPDGAFYTDTYGESWQVLRQGSDSYSGVLIHPEDSNVMWVSTSGGMIEYTTNGGTSWNATPNLPFAFYPDFELCQNNNGDFRVLLNFEQLAETVYYSDDLGASFSPATGLDGATYFTDCSVRPAGDLPQMVYLSTNKGIYKSADGAVYEKCPNLNGMAWSVLGSRGTDVYAGAENGVFHSTDEGQTWQAFNTNIDYVAIWDLVYGNTTDVIFAGTRGYSVYAYGLEPFVGVNPLQDLISKISISPNPANDHFVINNAETGDLRIINLSGTVLMEMPINSNKQKIDISHLPAGLYLIFFNTEKGNDIKKLVKK